MNPIKYPSLYTNKQVTKILEKIQNNYITAVIQPKYDGSNISILKGQYYTRNLHNLDQGLEKLVEKAIPIEDKKKLKELSNNYQIYMEVGGRQYCPARYCTSWNKDYEYKIIDMINPETKRFIPTQEQIKITIKHDLPYVETATILDPMKLHENWIQELEKYKKYEGYVTKIEIPENQIKPLWKKYNHRQFNKIITKYKHEYLTKQPKPYLEESEILAVIDRVVHEHPLIDNINDLLIITMKHVKEEAKKHNRKKPSPKRIKSLLIDYLQAVKNI